ncbi:MAG: glycosyltransferase [Chitinispirillaceae bacterium]|nr:glycosyltransferase [Chitinispirillaceae bacterium]
MTEKFNPKVSIVIPVYNGSNYLAEAIDSALAQTYDNFEIIVVNDGSRDEGKTARVANAYGDKIRYFEKENGGVATALNYGISKMCGEYFSWLSHDDLYTPEKIALQVEHLALLDESKRKSSLVYGHFDYINSNGKCIGREAHPFYKNGEFLYSLIKERYIHGCTLLIPKEAFLIVGNFNPELRTVQDYWLWYEFILKGYSFLKVDCETVHSRVHPNQDSIAKKVFHIAEEERMFCWLLNVATPEQLWGANKNDAAKYFYMALMFAKQELMKSFHHACRLSKQCEKKVSIRTVRQILSLLVIVLSPVKVIYSRIKLKIKIR